MAIKKVNTLSEYAAQPKSIQESTLTGVSEGNRVMTDGVNVVKQTAQFGDAVYVDGEGQDYIIDRNTLQHSLIPDGWTYRGVFIGWYNDGRMRVFMGNYASLPSQKYADVVQHKITAITSTEITINLRIQDTSKSGDAQYATNIPVNVTLTSTEINATTAAEISAAVAAKATEMGDQKAWWAWLADDNYNKVETGGTRIIVQCDTWVNYQMYVCSMTGGTIAFCTWRGMPVSNWYMRKTGVRTSSRGIMNVNGGVTYWSDNGLTPTANVPVASGDTDPVNKTAFEESAYCADLRQAYTTYREYISIEYGIMRPQKFGVFGIADGETLTAKYGPMTAPTKTGGVKVMFPAMNWAYLQGGHLWDVNDGCDILEDSNLAIINSVQRKVGRTTISAATTRWFCQRCNAYNAWFFNGYYRKLSYYIYVNNTFQVGAVQLLKHKG